VWEQGEPQSVGGSFCLDLLLDVMLIIDVLLFLRSSFFCSGYFLFPQYFLAISPSFSGSTSPSLDHLTLPSHSVILLT
jgi:hypothetical protein